MKSEKGEVSLYRDILKNELNHQQTVLEQIRTGDFSGVAYEGYRDKEYGIQDKNYTNRLRLAYYILFNDERLRTADDCQNSTESVSCGLTDEALMLRLFEEELKDRETNSFQGIGSCLEVLTCLLRNYNADGRYTSLFERAKNANFDCACGYSPDCQVRADFESYDILACLYLARELDYPDALRALLTEWKAGIQEWTENNRRLLIWLQEYLGENSENEILYRENVEAALKEGKNFDIVSKYRSLLHYYVETEDYEKAFQCFEELKQNADLSEVYHVNLFRYILEDVMDMICHYETEAQSLWQWSKPFVLEQGDKMHGNLYRKAADAARVTGDQDAGKLAKAYEKWKKKMSLR